MNTAPGANNILQTLHASVLGIRKFRADIKISRLGENLNLSSRARKTWQLPNMNCAFRGHFLTPRQIFSQTLAKRSYVICLYLHFTLPSLYSNTPLFKKQIYNLCG